MKRNLDTVFRSPLTLQFLITIFSRFNNKTIFIRSIIYPLTEIIIAYRYDKEKKKVLIFKQETRHNYTIPYVLEIHFSKIFSKNFEAGKTKVSRPD